MLQVIRDEFVAAANVAASLLRDPAVASNWDEPSALAEFGVAGLAGHLGYQVIAVPEILDAPAPTEEKVDVLTHFQRVPWIGADVHDEFNVRVRDGVRSSPPTGQTLSSSVSSRRSSSSTGSPTHPTGRHGCPAGDRGRSPSTS